jgi:hypothetical protein
MTASIRLLQAAACVFAVLASVAGGAWWFSRRPLSARPGWEWLTASALPLWPRLGAPAWSSSIAVYAASGERERNIGDQRGSPDTADDGSGRDRPQHD